MLSAWKIWDWKVRQRGLERKRYIFREALIIDEIIMQWKTLAAGRVGGNAKDVESMKDPDMYMEKLPEGIIQSEIALCEAALEKTRKVIGDVPVMIDHTFHPRPLELAKLLLTHGFSVTRIYLMR